jgi:hypothetical protein
MAFSDGSQQLRTYESLLIGPACEAALLNASVGQKTGIIEAHAGNRE